MHTAKRFLLTACLLSAAACSWTNSHTAKGSSKKGAGELIYVASFAIPALAPGSPSNPDAEGIYGARLDVSSGQLTPLGMVAQSKHITWLAVNPGQAVLYSTGLSATGAGGPAPVDSFAVDLQSGQLRPASNSTSGGTDASQLIIDNASRTLFVANHGSGDVSAMPLHPDGSIVSAISMGHDFGDKGPNPRQTGPEAHGVAIDPTDRYVFVADFGVDRVFVYQFRAGTRELQPAQIPYVQLPSGSGPRHLSFNKARSLLFVVTELTAQLNTYRWDGGRARLVLIQSLPTYPAGEFPDLSSAVGGAAGELLLSPDERHAYVSIRARQNVIIVYDVGKSGSSAQEVQRISAQGDWPWCMTFDPSGRWLLVGNERSGTVVEFSVNGSTGKLAPTTQTLIVPHPVALATLRP